MVHPSYIAQVLVLLAAAYVPAILALIWLRWGERGHKEQWDDLFMTFLGGAIVAVVAATVLEIAASTALNSTVVREYGLFAQYPNLITFLIIIVIAPVIEEFVKMLVVKRFSRYIWRPRNGLVFGAACGLGFAATENFLYEGTALFHCRVRGFRIPGGHPEYLLAVDARIRDLHLWLWHCPGQIL